MAIDNQVIIKKLNAIRGLIKNAQNSIKEEPDKIEFKDLYEYFDIIENKLFEVLEYIKTA